MGTDVIIAASVAAIQVVLVWYGVHVTTGEHRLRNAIFIGLIGGFGIGLTIWGAIRNGVAEQQLQTQLGNIQKNTETPPKVEVNVATPSNPPKHGEVVFDNPSLLASNPVVPPKSGQIPELNIVFRALEGSAVTKELYGAVIVIPVALIDNGTAFLKYRKDIKTRTTGGTLTTDERAFYTFSGKALGEQDVSDINAGKAGICAIGFINWSDQTGSYETDGGHCYFHESDGGWQWHGIVENNRETKLP